MSMRMTKVMLVMMLAGACVIGATTARAGNIVCDPDPLLLAVGGADGTISVEYLGGASGPIYGYSLEFTWDATKVSTTAAAVSEGDLLTEIGTTFFNASEDGNTISISTSLLGDQPGASEAGTLFSVVFAGLMPGESPLDLTLIAFRDGENNPLTGLEEEDGTLVVTGEVECAMLDVVDIGDTESEALHALESWGPIEPANSGGNYGGVDNCRVVYASEANGDGDDFALVRLVFGTCPDIEKRLVFRHLDGISNDSFEMYMYPFGQPEESALIFTYEGDDSSEEIWFESSVVVAAAGRQTIEIVSTEDPWSGWGTYGQVAFDSLYVELCQPLADIVDIGNPDSEAGHALSGWGPIEPANSGGNYGGIDDCRVVFASEENGDGENWATVNLQFGEVETTKCLEIDHLDGGAQDSWDLFIYPVGHPEEAEMVYAYQGDDSSQEIWFRKRLVVTAACEQTLMFVSTGPQWPGWPTYGQLAIDTVMVEGCTPTDLLNPADLGDIGYLMRASQPNPFHDRTTMTFTLSRDSRVELAVYDVAGREIDRLVSGKLLAGEHRVTWDGRNDEDVRMPAGLYLYRLEVNGRIAQSGKMVHLQ